MTYDPDPDLDRPTPDCLSNLDLDRHLVGEMDDAVPFLGTPFNTWLPLLIVAFALCALCKAHTRLMKRVGMELYDDPDPTSAEHQSQIRVSGIYCTVVVVDVHDDDGVV